MRQFYDLEQEKESILWANVGREHKFDFWHEDIYNLPLEYPHVFKMIHGEFQDYTGTDSYPIFSTKLRDIFNEFIPKERIEWIHLTVENKDGSLHDAYMPRFIPMPHMIEVLNEKLSVFTEHGQIMVPRLSTEKTKDIHFIRLVENSLINYVSVDLKKAMQKAKVTGVKFKKVKMYP
ncbi:MAG: Unknown protein [uncultured Sulfurovum sp.]|uniref:Immunity MXAN-0049 protein domain-containing protein n=1 Tax=uncultured Sulfurovum sp. TaxID=269237 RepID=A0A6S6T3R3_9BACT|nr:MAG: Unknown protein [uncultured Sulfurovum sp.]